MKKILFVACLAFSAFISYAAPTEKALASFNRCFPDAKDVQWVDDHESYMVYFARENEKFRLWYNKDGVVIKSIKYYGKDGLPVFLRSRVEDKYKDKKIYGITEVTTDAGVLYQLILEDDKRWYHVNSDATGNMSIVEKFHKA